MSAPASSWETSLFSGSSVPAGRPPAVPEVGIDARVGAARRRIGRVSARQAFQEAVHHRAWVVDIRPEGQRRAEGELASWLPVLTVERNVLEWRFDPLHGARLPQASVDARLLVLCQEGYASSLAAESLLDLGVPRVADVIGGLAAWRRAGLPMSGDELRAVPPRRAADVSRWPAPAARRPEPSGEVPGGRVPPPS